ncbi:hypothetical protein FB45DRAFT_273115 [Roridomyces roridus]|uniref:F-box domain-containing protein n=1 Tax=Roridomyces roridus TaxID=1738132 RepID=A0AAD7FB09_9AGAR|nr:hypothetical protein FB45DRAFT_273115 [Roridomyces roridus]
MPAPLPASSELAAARSRIAQLDMEIEGLKRSLELRLAERDRCRDVLAQYKYPILTLPSEISSEIFMQFLSSGYTPFIPLVGSESPPFLLQICRQWRNIALGTPALWSSFQVNLQRRNSESLRKQKLQRLELWLERSGSCPLSIGLWDVPLGPVTTSVPSSKFPEAIMRHAARLQHIHVEVPYEKLRGFTSAPMPILRSVLIGPTDGNMLADTTPSETAVSMCMLAPNLREVNLSTTTNPFTIILPWSQITTLTAELYIPEAIHVLRQTTALETCTLTIYGYADFTPTHLAVSLLRLRSLILHWGDGMPDDSLVVLVDALTLPVLDSLVVSENLLGADPIAALSRLRPQGYPRVMEIENAALSFEVYRGVFADAILKVESAEED